MAALALFRCFAVLLLTSAAALSVAQQPPRPFTFDPAQAGVLTRGHAGFRLAALNGSLYVWREIREYETRATSTLHGLLHLSLSHRVPDLLAAFVTATDDVQPGEQNDALPVFDFFRVTGKQWPLLWPDWDFFGWPDAYLAPFSALARQMRKEQPEWRHRADVAFWTGSVLTDNRHLFQECSHAKGSHMHAQGVGWKEVHNHNLSLPFAKEGLHMKPHSVDLRKYFTYRYGVFLTGNSWSTSMKRIAASGVALLLPEPNAYEDLTSLAFAGCGCTYSYNASREAMCASLNQTWALASADEAEAAGKAYRSREFVERELSMEKVMDYMLGTLTMVAGTQQLGALNASTLAGAGYEEVTCAWLKARYKERLSAHIYWQVEAWMDPETCALRAEIDYLAYSAVRHAA